MNRCRSFSLCFLFVCGLGLTYFKTNLDSRSIDQCECPATSSLPTVVIEDESPHSPIVPPKILRVIPEKIQELFPVYSQYTFDQEEPLSVVERQKIRLKMIETFCNSEHYKQMNQETTLKNPHRVTLMRKWSCLACRNTKTGSSICSLPLIS